MFRVNRKTDYAVRVVVALAKHPAGTRLPTQQIQDEMLVPRPFLQRIVAELSAAGLIRTYTGPNGGLELARPAEQISLRDLVEIMEGPTCISECLELPHECPLSSACPVRSRWGRLQAVILHELARTTIWQLAQEALQSGVQLLQESPIPLETQAAEIGA